MKFTLMIPTATLAALLAASPGMADEKADASSKTEVSGSTEQGVNASSETSGSATVKAGRKTGEVMFGQMMAIQAQMGLHRGNEEEARREMRASARARTEALAAEAKAVLGADATPQEIREFFRARMSGYNTVAEMRQDITTVLGTNPNHGAVKAYLLLRRAEMEGLSGRTPDFEALRAEVEALGDVKVGELRGLLREKIRATVGRDDADKKEGENKDKAEDAKEERKLLTAELKAEHKVLHEEKKEDQKEARQEKLEANIDAKVEARLRELETNTEAKLDRLEAQKEKVEAKIEAKREEV